MTRRDLLVRGSAAEDRAAFALRFTGGRLGS